VLWRRLVFSCQSPRFFQRYIQNPDLTRSGHVAGPPALQFCQISALERGGRHQQIAKLYYPSSQVA
jgi:hypothetical protein